MGLITLEELGSWHPGGGSQGCCSTIPQYTDSTQPRVTLASSVTSATWRNPDPYNKRFNLIFSFFLEYSMVFYCEGLELEYILRRGKRQSPFRIFFFFLLNLNPAAQGSHPGANIHSCLEPWLVSTVNAEQLKRFILYCDFCNLFFKRIVCSFSLSETNLWGF